MKAVIYKIENLVNKKCYVGSTISFDERKKYHLWQLKKGSHHSIILQRAWNKYGENNFIIDIIKIVDFENIIQEEQNEIDIKGYYNSTKIAGLPPKYNVKIIVYDADTNLIGSFDSTNDFKRQQGINICGHGKYPYYSKGFFIFKPDTEQREIISFINRKHDKRSKIRPVFQYTLEKVFIKRWEDTREASIYYSGKKLNNNILQSIKTNGSAYGFIWSFDSL